MLWSHYPSVKVRNTISLTLKCRKITALATSVDRDPSRIRNLAVVAHIDSGKTTLTESILLTSNYLTSPGSVDTGSTTTDFLPVERERGITIQSASIPVIWKDWSINLIDTPGHADFGMEVESASRVVDGALVLIDSVEGVEAQTKGVWRQLDRYEVPTRMIFLNKLDRPGSSIRSSILSIIHHGLHPRPTLLTLPIASFNSQDYQSAEPGIAGIVDLVAWKIWKWGPNGIQRADLPRTEAVLKDDHILPKSHPLHAHLLPARISFLDNISMFSEPLLQNFLDSPPGSSAYLSLDKGDIISALRKSVLKDQILPILCGSALHNIGTDLVLDYACELLACPLDLKHITQSKESPVQVVVWKVGWDKMRGWMTFIRVYSGTLKKQMSLINVTRAQTEKVAKLLLLYANQPEEVDTLCFGSVGVILGLKYTRTGDTLISTRLSTSDKNIRKLESLRDITPPVAVVSASIIPQSGDDTKQVQDALSSLTRTDPSVRVEFYEGQLLVHGLGTLHLEIVEGRLRDEWGVRFEVGKRRVSYREGLGKESVEFRGEWMTESNGKPIQVGLWLSIRTLQDDEPGDNLWDDNIVLGPNNEILKAPGNSYDKSSVLANISSGIAIALSSSPHTSLPLSRLHIHIKDFHLPPGGHPSAFIGASSKILRDAIIQAGMGQIMEPYVRIKVEVSEEHFGKVIKDLTESDSEITELESSSLAISDTPYGDSTNNDFYIPPAWLSPATSPTARGNAKQSAKRSILAAAPLYRMLDFSTRLKAISAGHGNYEMSNNGFRVVSKIRKIEILREIGKA